jgi:hypothetical protein
MLRFLAGSGVLAALCLAAAGCGGDQKLQTKGKLMKGGKPFIPAAEEQIRVTFVPILPSGGPPRDHYHAVFNRDDATFKSAGKDLKGMPPGKYRVAVEYKKNKQDMFDGKFDEMRSPFVFDVDAATPEILIDLDSPPKKG